MQFETIWCFSIAYFHYFLWLRRANTMPQVYLIWIQIIDVSTLCIFEIPMPWQTKICVKGVIAIKLNNRNALSFTGPIWQLKPSINNDMSRKIHTKLWPKSNMTMLLNFVSGRMVFYSQQNFIKYSLVYKDKPTNCFLTNDEYVSVNCNKIFHANFTDE